MIKCMSDTGPSRASEVDLTKNYLIALFQFLKFNQHRNIWDFLEKEEFEEIRLLYLQKYCKKKEGN